MYCSFIRSTFTEVPGVKTLGEFKDTWGACPPGVFPRDGQTALQTPRPELQKPLGQSQRRVSCSLRASSWEDLRARPRAAPQALPHPQAVDTPMCSEASPILPASAHLSPRILVLCGPFHNAIHSDTKCAALSLPRASTAKVSQ